MQYLKAVTARIEPDEVEYLLSDMSTDGYEETVDKLQLVIEQCYGGNVLSFAVAFATEVMGDRDGRKKIPIGEVIEKSSAWADEKLEAAHLAGEQSEIFGLTAEVDGVINACDMDDRLQDRSFLP